MSSFFKVEILGEYDTENRENEQKFTATYVVHPRFKNDNGRSLVYDFAILRLNRDVDFTDEVSPACLPAEGLSSRQAVVVGWGNEKAVNRYSGLPGLVKGSGYKLATILQELDVNFISDSKCRQSYSQLGIELAESNMCAVSEVGDTCTGDSGGGIFVNNNG